MSRQRLRLSLGESHPIVCPRCTGQGVVRSTESLALSILRLVEEEAMKEKTGKVVIRLPIEVGTFLLNEKRDAIFAIENRHGVGVVMVPDPNIESPHYDIERIDKTIRNTTYTRSRATNWSEVSDATPDFAKEARAQAEPEPAVKRIAATRANRSTAITTRRGVDKALVGNPVRPCDRGSTTEDSAQSSRGGVVSGRRQGNSGRSAVVAVAATQQRAAIPRSEMATTDQAMSPNPGGLATTGETPRVRFHRRPSESFKQRKRGRSSTESSKDNASAKEARPATQNH